MPLYIARRSGTMAFLIHARSREHLDAILEEKDDAVAHTVEVYGGPLCLALSVPASVEGEPVYSSPEPELRARFEGSSTVDALRRLPSIDPFDAFDGGWSQLRRCAFPSFGMALDEILQHAEEGEDVSREALERAIAADVIEQGRLALWRERRVEGQAHGGWQILDMMLSPGSPRANRSTGALRREGGSGEGIDAVAEEPEARAVAGDHAAELRAQMIEAIVRFGEIGMVVNAEEVRWRVGNPPRGEGPTLAAALANAGA